jgi:ELWxxDGT repeat protein
MAFRLRSIVVATALAALLSGPLAGQGAPASGPELVRDLAPGAAVSLSGPSSPESVRRVGDRVVILAEGALGDLWSTDGTPEGTVLLAHLRARPADVSLPDQRIVDQVGERLLVDAHSGFWVTDGTAAGTRHLELPTGVRYLGAAGDEALFLADGLAQRVLVRDLSTGARRSFAPPVRLSERGGSAGDRLVLLVGTGDGTEAIGVTDGTAAGTEILAVEPPDDVFELLYRFVTVGETRDRVFFVSYSGGRQVLWASDGTAAGTVALPVPGAIQVQDFGLIPDPAGFGVAVVTSVDGALSPWVTDGTVAGTRRVDAPVDTGALSKGRPPIWAGGVLYFAGIEPDRGAEPWSFDPRTAVARRLADLCPGACGSEPQNLAAIGDGDDGLGGNGNGLFVVGRPAPEAALVPWVVDVRPSDATVQRLARPPGPESDDVHLLAELPGVGHLVAATHTLSDALYLLTPSEARLLAVGEVFVGAVRQLGGRVIVPLAGVGVGQSVLSTDGTVAGTLGLPGLGPIEAAGSRLERLTASGDRLFFQRGGSGGGELWVSDGTAAGTHPVRGPLAERSPLQLLGSSGDGGVFLVDSGRLWWTDGTAAGSFPLEGAGLGYVAAENTWLAPDGELYLLEGRFRLSRTDRATRTLVPLIAGDGVTITAVAPGPPGSGRLYAATLSTVDENDLPVQGFVWETDGTVAGTEALFPVDWVSALAWFRGELYQLVVGPQGGTLRATATPRNPPAGGGRVVTTLGSAVSSASPRVLVTDRAVFFAFGGYPADGLWATDGTAAGTRRLLDIEVSRALVVGDRVVVTTDAVSRDTDLYWSDGTPLGTARVDGFLPVIGDLLAVDGQLLWTAATRATGAELWASDGPDDARLVFDLTPGPASSAPSGLARVGGEILFAAAAPATGRELWKLPLAEALHPLPTPPARAPLTSSALPGFRVWVDITPRGEASVAGVSEGACPPETICVSGALPGRTEAFVRVIGPRPNGRLWPVVTRFTPSRLEIWIQQISTGALRYYDLPATDPAPSEVGDLPGLIDREGFLP